MFDNIFEPAIMTGGYDLNAMLDSIERAYIEGTISAAKRDALKEFARENAEPTDSYAPIDERVAHLEAALKALESRVSALEGGTETPAEDWPEFVQPKGSHDAYAAGAQVTWNGEHWRSLLDGNVWSPAAYPQGWEKVE